MNNIFSSVRKLKYPNNSSATIFNRPHTDGFSNLPDKLDSTNDFAFNIDYLSALDCYRGCIVRVFLLPYIWAFLKERNLYLSHKIPLPILQFKVNTL